MIVYCVKLTEITISDPIFRESQLWGFAVLVAIPLQHLMGDGCGVNIPLSSHSIPLCFSHFSNQEMEWVGKVTPGYFHLGFA